MKVAQVVLKCCSCYSWRMWKDRLIVYISRVLFEKGERVFHFCLLSKTKLIKRVTQLFVFELCQCFLGSCIGYLFASLWEFQASFQISRSCLFSVGFWQHLKSPLRFFYRSFWEVACINIFPNSSEEQHAFCQLITVIWKIAFFGGHGYLSLPIHSACEVYWDRSAWKWQHRIFLAVKGCAWRYLVWWEQAVCQNCCWFPKHLLRFASSVLWWLWLLLRPRLAWSCITFSVSSRDHTRCGRSDCCCSRPNAALQVCSRFCSCQQEAAGISVCPEQGRQRAMS